MSNDETQERDQEMPRREGDGVPVAREDEEAAPAAAEGPDETLSEVERLQAELKQAEDKVLRKTAEFENYRRRMRQTRRQAREEGRAEVVKRLLEVIDDFERSLQAAAQSEEDDEGGPAFQTLKEGVELVYKKFVDELGKLDIERLEAEGHPFDEGKHEAMMQQPAPEDVTSGTVLQEIEPGYRMGERILRHAKVVVAQ